MEPKNMKIEFSSSLLDVVEKNPSFDMGKLRVAYTGKNRNNTFISKESFERAIPTMFNCPVVANYNRKKDEIGSHDGEFIKDKDGETKYVNITQPVGLVPESAQWNWENVDDNGVMHQYLCTEVVLWKRQEAYSKLKESGITKQSMEIEVTNGEMLDDYYDIKDFCFTAFCLLGTAEPCFESAALFTFAEQEDFKKQYTEMLKEFKLAFASASENDKKEGKENLKLKELLEKYSVAEEDLKFEVEGLSDEELETKFAEEFEEKKKDDADSDPVEGEEDDEVEDEPEDEVDPVEPVSEEDENSNEEGGEGETDDESGTSDGTGEEGGEGSEDFTLNSQVRENLSAAIREADTIETDWGSYSRYWMIDYDEATQEVFFYDETDWKLYGCGYSFDGDDIKVDIEAAKRKKYVIVDYVEGSEPQEFALAELIETFNNKYAEVKVDAEEFERLKNFEHDILTAKREASEKALFDKFENKLKDNEEFKALKEKASEYELDALEKELFALVGKVDFAFSLKNMSQNSADDKPKPMVGFEAMFSAVASTDDEAMNSFMEKQLKK